MYWVYILKSEHFEKSYVGYTNNVKKRLLEHNNGRSIFTNIYKPWKLVYSEMFENKTKAIKREKFFKSKTGRKFLKNIVFK